MYTIQLIYFFIILEREYDADKHCGVQLPGEPRCLRSLTCKTHTITLKRSVRGYLNLDILFI